MGLEWYSPFVTVVICVAVAFLILLAARRCVASVFDDDMLASPDMFTATVADVTRNATVAANATAGEGAPNLAGGSEWETWYEGQEDEAAQGSWWSNWFAQQRGK